MFPNLVIPIGILFFLIGVFIMMLDVILDSLKSPKNVTPGRRRNKLKLVAIGWATSFVIACVALVLTGLWPAYSKLFMIIFIVFIICSVVIGAYSSEFD